MAKKQKLELTWIGKDEEVKLEPRVLVEDTELSYGDRETESMIIHGDNLLALKALEQEYAGKVKCIYIDPPYNTGNAFEHYDDGIEHSLWLSLMNNRLKLLKKLLSKDGIIWVNLDDNEVHYCKVMMDEIFGRNNFLGTVVWEKADSPRMDSKFFSTRHDQILCYASSLDNLSINRIFPTEIPLHYNKKDSKGDIYYLKPLRGMGVNGYREKRPSLYFGMIAPDGEEVFPINPDGSDSCWRWSKDRIEKDKHRLEWIKTKTGWSLYFRIYLKDSEGLPPETLWHHQSVGSNRSSKKEIKDLFPEDIFLTPKPEKLIERVIHISSKEGDLVLDSFLGSGTTAAVAHKMNRKYIGIELGEHAKTHVVPRLQKVIDGNDTGGISKSVNWKSGGGFKFYTIAPSLLTKDRFSNWIIEPTYDATLLASAMAKQEGFKYYPDENLFWKQGYSTETDYIFTTTQFLTTDILDKIHDEMKEDETLLICAKSFQKGCEKAYTNITIKKIPQVLLGKCEFGKDNYSLNILKNNDEDKPSEGEDE